MFESWQKCPVKFASLKGRHGYYDKVKDEIIIDLEDSLVSPLFLYLILLFIRDHYGKKSKKWIRDQVELVWNTMSVNEKWELGNCLFNGTFEEKS